MHTQIKTFLFTLVILIAAFACDENYHQPITRQDSPDGFISTRSTIKEENNEMLCERKSKILKNNIPAILSGFMIGDDVKRSQGYSINSVSNDRGDILHIVNFNSGGWAMVSGIYRDDSPILARSDSGTFDPDHIDNPEIAFWFERVKDAIEKELSIIENDGLESQSIRSINYDDPYVWVRFPLGEQYSTVNNYSNLNHLTQTQWGQDEPWNYLCPAYGNDLCLLGCTPVAVGQLLYYLNGYLGKPSGLYHSIIPTYTYHYSSSGSYVTSTITRSNYNSPSTRWSDMPLSSPGYLSTEVQYVGDFLIDIANRASSKFYPRSQGTEGSTSTSLFSNYYNISCSKSNTYVESTVINSLNTSIPVLVSGADSTYGSHEWLIDGYNSSLTNVDHLYKWRMVPPDSLNYYYNQYDLVYTEQEMQQFYPDVIENEIIHEYSSYITYMLRMNWGWNGSHLSDLYSMSPLGWNVDLYHLKNNVHFYYNFH